VLIRTIQTTVVMVCFGSVGAGVSAHRLDELLQAAKIELQRDAVRVTLDMTPGAAVAEAVIRAVDRNGDEQMATNEQQAYGTAVVGALMLTLDGVSLPAAVEHLTFAEGPALRRGEGAIRLVVTARHQALAPGRHQLHFSNAYSPERSVYLANVLVPQDGRTTVQQQRRSADQRELTIEYSLSSPVERIVAPALMVGGLVVFLSVRQGRMRSQRG